MSEYLFRPPGNVAWNIFLALIPVALAALLASLPRRLRAISGRWVIIGFVTVVWGVFLPNTCYLATEWRHYFDTITQLDLYHSALSSHHGMAIFLALTLFYVCYSGAGLIAFFLSIWPLDRIVRRRYPHLATALRVCGFLLCAIGVYLGLIHRFNSWDLATRPEMHIIFTVTIQALSSRFTVLLISTFALFLWLLYWCFDVLMDGLRFRRQRAGRTTWAE